MLMPKGRPPPPLTLTKGVQAVGTFYHNKNFEVSADYLKCLVNNMALANKGLELIEHKRLVGHYSNLLSFLDGTVNLPIGDHLLDEAAMLEDARVPGLLGIEDRKEGDPVSSDDEVLVVPEAAPSASELLPPGQLSSTWTKWGEFTVRTLASELPDGTMETKLHMRCPYHRDPGDPSGTKCIRSIIFTTPESKVLAWRTLQGWALEGRNKEHRDLDTHNSHKPVRNDEFELKTKEEFDKELEDALKNLPWILAHRDAVNDSSSDTGGPS